MNKGKQLSSENGQSVLVSTVKPIQVEDPLAILESEKTQFQGTRSYWSDPDKEIVLIGFGNAFTLQTQGIDRFGQVSNRWKSLLENAVYDHPTVPGTGPVLIGGFSFDPLKPKTKLWEKFDHTRLVLPEFMLTVSKNKAYFTANLFISHEDDIEQTIQNIVEMEHFFTSKAKNTIVPLLKQHGFEKREVEPERWKQAVRTLSKEIREGELDKVVLARELRVITEQPFSPYSVLYHLREEQPLSYLFAVENGTDCFVGASPERLVKRMGDEVMSTCLAGSNARGDTPEMDQDLGEMLLQDQKNLHEHQIVVKMIKSEMEKGCNQLEVPKEPELMKLRNIQHLYTPVKGIAKDGVSIIDLVELLHPTPALGGFPKESALHRIREHELVDRGWYAGPIGWVDANGNGEFAVAIRSGLLQGNEASLFAGCGIVGDSDPESEYQETNLKLKPMLSALGE